MWAFRKYFGKRFESFKRTENLTFTPQQNHSQNKLLALVLWLIFPIFQTSEAEQVQDKSLTWWWTSLRSSTLIIYNNIRPINNERQRSLKNNKNNLVELQNTTNYTFRFSRTRITLSAWAVSAQISGQVLTASSATCRAKVYLLPNSIILEIIQSWWPWWDEEQTVFDYNGENTMLSTGCGNYIHIIMPTNLPVL